MCECVSVRIETVVNVYADVFDLEFGTERNARRSHGEGKFAKIETNTIRYFSYCVEQSRREFFFCDNRTQTNLIIILENDYTEFDWGAPQ